MIGIWGSHAIVHIWGALLRIQPISETLATGMYAGLGLLAVAFYPG
jgi:hypothetical protein